MQYHVYNGKIERFLGNIKVPGVADKVLAKWSKKNHVQDGKDEFLEFCEEDGSVIFEAEISKSGKLTGRYVLRAAGADSFCEEIEALDGIENWLRDRCIPKSERHQAVLKEALGFDLKNVVEVARVTRGRLSSDRRYLTVRGE